MSVQTLLIIILIIVLLGAYPGWGYAQNLGYGPFGLVGVILIIVLVLVLTGRI